MHGRIVYPITRDVVVLTDELWLERPSISCYMRASNSGVYEDNTSSLAAYISSAFKLQNYLQAYLHSYDGLEEPSQMCYIVSPIVWSSVLCWMNSSDLFKGHDSQFCFLSAGENFFLTQAAFVAGLQSLSFTTDCYVVGNEIIQFVQDCYIT